ncbi:site-specific integrase [Hyphomicrobium sp.]|uniref:tyrosine-type recombinase/integrase n=1 Tax=Hyphomicrobium sp. TaxID=82 RepID=UPI001DCD935B|nr:site-specific integrase [Hyphomicrobium sp.]MBY0561970.1 tyrosine-type recombinase/integrase [Hyphomicrobium sp.]
MSRKLTARFVETLKANGHRTDFRDAAVSGLELRLSQSGVKSWALRYRRQSDRAKRIITLGTFPEYSLDDARNWAEDRKREIARGEDPAAGKRARKEAVTFRELAEDWVERHGKVNKSERALRDDQSMLARHINPELGSMKAVEVRKRDIIRLLDIVGAKDDARAGERPATKQKRLAKPQRRGNAAAANKGATKAPRRMTHRPNRVFEVVRTIFRWAVGRDVLQIDPTVGISPPIKREKARERELTVDEIRKLWAALEATPVERRKLPKGSPTGERVVGERELRMTRATALAIQISLVTAQRIGEVAGIARSELDLNDTAPIWIIPRERTKNGEPNRVPLSPLAVKLIRAAMALSEGNKTWLFPSATDAEKTIDPHAPTKAVERSRKALGIGNFRIHDLRRTAATGMAKLGINPHTVSLVLNHISVRRGTVTGKVYDQYTYDPEKRDALRKWGAQLERIIAGVADANVVSIDHAEFA